MEGNAGVAQAYTLGYNSLGIGFVFEFPEQTDEVLFIIITIIR